MRCIGCCHGRLPPHDGSHHRPGAEPAFYEALGFRFSRDMDIVRNGELEATNYFFSIGDAENVLELTFNHDGRTYELGTAYGHVAIGVDDLDGTLAQLADQGIEPERPPYSVRSRAARGSASSATRTSTASSSSSGASSGRCPGWSASSTVSRPGRRSPALFASIGAIESTWRRPTALRIVALGSRIRSTRGSPRRVARRA